MSARSDQGIDLGSKLRSARLAKGLSQRELARRSGVTNGLISQLEQNRSSPSVSSLKRILDAIPMTLAEFFVEQETERKKIFYRAAELYELNPAAIFRLGKDAENKISLRQVGQSGAFRLQMLHERYVPGAGTGDDLYSHDGEEAGIVVSGEIELTVGDQMQILKKDEAYIFASTTPHRFRNIGAEDCVIISCCTPPSF